MFDLLKIIRPKRTNFHCKNMVIHKKINHTKKYFLIFCKFADYLKVKF